MCYDDGLWPAVWKAVADRLSKLIMVPFISKAVSKKKKAEFPGGPFVRSLSFTALAWIQPQVGELRFHKTAHSTVKEKRSCISFAFIGTPVIELWPSPYPHQFTISNIFTLNLWKIPCFSCFVLFITWLSIPVLTFIHSTNIYSLLTGTNLVLEIKCHNPYPQEAYLCPMQSHRGFLEIIIMIKDAGWGKAGGAKRKARGERVEGLPKGD